jgi:hypothetical protein
MRYIDAGALADPRVAATAEVRHALLSYHGRGAHSAIALDAVDHAQQLVRLKYWVHGAAPYERFVVDDRVVEPAFAKYRSCRYLRRDLLRQRIVWLPVSDDSTTVQVDLDGAPAPIVIGPPEFGMASGPAMPLAAPLAAARRRYPRAKGPAHGRTAARWRARLLLALARVAPVRRRFAEGWVFADREHDADDNAEHLYRWVREHHPEINAWFLMQPGTRDWQRLSAEGFRLMAPGLQRKLLLLNSRHIVSSHPDYALGRMDARVYGDAMRWRFTYLKHGVVANDQSHYYANRDFDCVIAPSPAEYRAFVGDDTPYEFTAREVMRCNLPRYDRLLRLARETDPADVNEVVVMPTWRDTLLDDRLGPAERMDRLASSDYVRAWGRVLRDEAARALLERHGKRLVFVPHSNLVPYLDAFELPPSIRVAREGAFSIQQRLARCCVFVTDYTSVAFDVALLRRAVLYYQFDRDRFYGGDHNWRPGYFDYVRDGFGPVAHDHDDLMRHLDDLVARGGEPAPVYRARMERALPDRGASACRQVFEAIVARDRPFRGRGDDGVTDEANAAAGAADALSGCADSGCSAVLPQSRSPTSAGS